jgi:uncharacterized protein
MRRADRAISGAEEVEEIISKADVCRLAFANDNYPYIVTMNFGYTNTPGQILYFHCAGEGKKIDMIHRNNYVCFEMDIDHQILKGKRSCDWGMRFTSIIGYGNIFEVTDKSERISGLNCIMNHYGGEGNYLYDKKIFEKTTILQLKILEMTAKKR